MTEDFEAGFDYSLDSENVKQGAEARIHQCLYLGRSAIMKERFSKKYRHEILDKRLNKTRTKNELKGIIKAQQLGVSTPAILFVDAENNKIIMERILGKTMNSWIEDKRNDLDRDQFLKVTRLLGERVGESIGHMHSGGLVHGDLTTSNIVLRDDDPQSPVFIDFGLSSHGKILAEDKGVDLYVLERAMASTHMDSVDMFEGVMTGNKTLLTGQSSEVLAKTSDGKQGEVVTKKLDEIRLRGRKRDMIG